MLSYRNCALLFLMAGLTLWDLSQPPTSQPKTIRGEHISQAASPASCVKDYVPRTSEEAELVQVENEWCDAAIHRDAKRLEAIFADDISWLEDVGYRNKAEVMHRYMVEIQEHMWELRDVRIRVIGTVGIVSSHIHVKKTTADKLTESDHTSIDVFEKRAGRWQLVAE
jgi:ketosteroid isomerase-like protein